MISRALLHEGTNVVMANPTFSQYHHHAVIEGAEVREVSLKDGIHDLDAMLEQVDEQPNGFSLDANFTIFDKPYSLFTSSMFFPGTYALKVNNCSFTLIFLPPVISFNLITIRL